MSRFNRSSLAFRFLPRHPFFRLLVTNGAAGLLISGLVIAGLFMADIGHLRILVANAENPVLPVILLSCGMIVTLTSVVIGSAIMMLGSEATGHGGRRHPSGELIPVRVAARGGVRSHGRHSD